MATKSDVLAKMGKITRDCNRSYKDSVRICKNYQNENSNLTEYYKELNNLKEKYHYKDIQKKLNKIQNHMNQNTFLRCQQYLLAILTAYNYCFLIDQEVNSNYRGDLDQFLLDSGMWITIPTEEIMDYIFSVKNMDIDDIDIDDRQDEIIGYICGSEFHTPLSLIRNNTFVQDIYSFMKGLK